MRSRWTLIFVPVLCLASLAWSADKVAEKSADEKAEDVFYANRMIISALEAEVKGDFTARERLLNEAAQLGVSPTAPAHLGMINVGAKNPEWKTIDESMAAAGKDEKLLRYEKSRQQSADTAAGHLAMAKWCLANKLPDQAQAHLTRVLDFAPDHAAVRAALGYMRMGDKWLSPQEIEQLQLRAAAKTTSIQKHGKTVAGLIEKMQSPNAKDRDAALAEFMAFKDPTAVGAVEAALNTPDEPTTKLLIEWMAQVDCLESSQVLVQYSLLHPNVLLRELATEQLVKRPLHDFVPELLEMLSSPIKMLVQPSYDKGGRLLGYRQAFSREGIGDKEIQVFDQLVRRKIIPVSRKGWMMNRNDIQNQAPRIEAAAQEQARLRMEENMLYWKLEMDRQNVLIQQVNERIANVVAKVSGKPLIDKADEMWTWWDEYNETEYQKYKSERYKNVYCTYSVPEHRLCSCFAAGTPVVTQTGPMAIEKIRVGDLVLNKDQQTGELNWRPVLRATVRTPFATVAISLEGETLRCTTGHLFWVSGIGWKKASELKAGDILHGAKSPSRVIAVESQPIAETYNLEVADSPNYFVGKHMLLTHDVTPLETNRQSFPGHDYVRQLSEQRPVRKTASR